MAASCVSPRHIARYGRRMARSHQRIGLPVVSAREVPLYTGHLTGQLEEHLRTVSRNRLAETITGGLSYPGKMPCPAWGLPASECRTGSRLAQIEGTICHACYAMKGTFRVRE